jgi:hypothetical protein
VRLANSYEIIEYKEKAMKEIINNREIVDLIDQSVIFPDDLLFENVFPSARSPSTEEEEKTYVFITVNVPTVRNKNNLMKDLLINFVIVTHQNLLRVQDLVGSRVDLLASKIDKAFNGSDAFGVGYLKLVSNVEGLIDTTHPSRTITFSIADFDNIRCNN